MPLYEPYVLGPATSTDNAIVRWDSTTGRFVQDSSSSIDDTGNLTIGTGAAGVDYTLTFNGETNDGVIRWMEDEDRLEIDDSVLITGTKRLSIGAEDTMVINGGNIASQLAIHSDTQAISEIHTHSATAALGGAIYGARSRGTEGAETAVQSGDVLFSIAGVGHDGTDYAVGAIVNFIVGTTPGSNDMPTDIQFATSPDGSQTPAEVLRLYYDKRAIFQGVTSVYRNDTATDAQFKIEQDSTGDATQSWLLTAGQEYRAYIDNSDSDSWKFDDQTGADNLLKYNPVTGTFMIGVVGDATIGDGTERNWSPQTDLKINWGTSTLRFNEGWFAELYASANAVGDPVFTIKSTATNDDPTQICYQNRVATTDATVTTLHTFTVPTSTTYMITAYVVARRTGGASGTAEDGAGYVVRGTYKNTAGTVAIIGAVSADYTAESQAGWDATLDTTGATVRIRVTGAASNSITWHSTAYIWQVAS